MLITIDYSGRTCDIPRKNNQYVNRKYGAGRGRILTRAGQAYKNVIGWQVRQRWHDAGQPVLDTSDHYGIIIEVWSRRDCGAIDDITQDAVCEALFGDDRPVMERHSYAHPPEKRGVVRVRVTFGHVAEIREVLP